jgi:hypothetical protein
MTYLGFGANEAMNRHHRHLLLGDGFTFLKPIILNQYFFLQKAIYDPAILKKVSYGLLFLVIFIIMIDMDNHWKFFPETEKGIIKSCSASIFRMRMHFHRSY